MNIATPIADQPIGVRRTQPQGDLSESTIETRDVTDLEDGGFSFQLSDKTRTFLVRALQEWFIVSSITSEYRWNIRPEDSQIQIMGEAPPIDRRFPYIAVMGRPFSESQIILGRKEFEEEVDDLLIAQKGGAVEIPVSIEIGARSAKSRDVIADLCTIGFGTFITEVMFQKEWQVVHNVIRLTSQDAPDDASEPEFKAFLQFVLQVPWTQKWIIPAETVESLALTISVDGGDSHQYS